MVTKNDIEEQFSRDAVYEGRLIIHQPQKGYRFSIDALLLTFFACQGRKVGRAADLGAGSGVVGLGLLASDRAEHVVGVELQPNLAGLALKNSTLNDFESRYEVINSDIRYLKGTEFENTFDLVTTNPPFWPTFEGRMPREEERRLACHEVSCTLEEWTKAAVKIMNHRRGRFVAVFPARRLDCLIVAMESARLSATRLRFVQPHKDKPAELVLVEARVGQTGRMEVEPPLILKDETGRDTEEAAAIVNGDFSDELKCLTDRR
jgi:tRNA1Val (adenine37-N6)-methyltransferase